MLRAQQRAASGRIPVSPRGAGIAAGLTCARQAFELSQRPWANTLIAALMSRSWTAPHRQVHDRMASGFGLSTRPHDEHFCDVGANRSTFPKVRPPRAALYSNIAVNCDQPASWMDFARRVRPSPVTHRSSTYTAWLSRMIAVDSLCCQSRRLSATRAWARATLTTAFLRF